MSFILDALKKSESERLRRDTPGFADVPDRKETKSTAPWVWIVGALVLVNVAVLSVLIVKPQSEPPADIVEAVPPPTRSADSPVLSPAAPPTAQTLSPQRPEPATAEFPPEPLASTEITPPEPSAESIPAAQAFATFNDLRALGTLQLPDLHLDIHVYSKEPEDRFVFVNMSKYKERAVLDEGPLVREITPEGVILEYGGAPFLLPRE